MADWIKRLDTIIQMNGRELLNHAGKISHEKALEKSAQESTNDARIVPLAPTAQPLLASTKCAEKF